MKNIEKEIEQFIQENREDMINTACRLVRIPSAACEDDSGYPYGRACAEALDYLDVLAKQYGLETEMYDYQGLEIRFPQKSPGKRVLFAAHTDVVPPSEGGFYPAFGETVDRNYIIGRGAVDDKVPLLAVLFAMVYLQKKHVPLWIDVRLFCGSHEETDMKDILYYLERAGQPDLGLAVDDDFPVTNGEKGVLEFVLRMAEKDGACGIDVVEKLLTDEKGELTGIHMVSETMGETVCCVKQSGAGECRIDARIPVELSVAEARERVGEFAKKSGMEFEVLKEEDGYYIAGDQGAPKILTDLYNEVTGADEVPYVMKGCTYARHFRCGCGFGAGDPHEKKPFPQGHGGAHQPDEAHNIDVFFNAVKMYVLGILRLNAYYTEGQ